MLPVYGVQEAAELQCARAGAKRRAAALGDNFNRARPRKCPNATHLTAHWLTGKDYARAHSGI